MVIMMLPDGRSGLVVADDQERECVSLGTFGNKPGFESRGILGQPCCSRRHGGESRR